MKFGKRLLRNPKSSSSSSRGSATSKPLGSTSDVSVTDEPSATEGDDFHPTFSSDDMCSSDYGPVSVDAFYSDEDDEDGFPERSCTIQTQPEADHSSRDCNVLRQNQMAFNVSHINDVAAPSSRESRNDDGRSCAKGTVTTRKNEYNGPLPSSHAKTLNGDAPERTLAKGAFVSPTQLNSQGFNQHTNGDSAHLNTYGSTVNSNTHMPAVTSVTLASPNRSRESSAFQTELYSDSMRDLVLELDEALAEVESSSTVQPEVGVVDLYELSPPTVVDQHSADTTNVDLSFASKDSAANVVTAAETSPTSVHEISAFQSSSFRTNSMRGLVRELDDALAEVESSSSGGETLVLPQMDGEAKEVAEDVPGAEVHTENDDSNEETIYGNYNNGNVMQATLRDEDNAMHSAEAQEGPASFMQDASVFRSDSFRSNSMRQLANELDEELTAVESKSELLSLREELSQLQERLEEALAQIQQQAECIDEANKEISFLEHLVDEKDLEIEKSNSVVNRLVSELMQAEEEIERSVQREREVHGNVIAEINCQMTEQKAEMDTLREDFQQKIAALNCKIADQCSQIEDWKEEVLQKTTALVAAEARCSALEKKLEDKPKGVWHLATATQMKNALMHGS